MRRFTSLGFRIPHYLVFDGVLRPCLNTLFSSIASRETRESEKIVPNGSHGSRFCRPPLHIAVGFYNVSKE
jgi:hypothetical protein